MKLELHCASEFSQEAQIMLAMTPAGDAYTLSELQRMLRNAGFSSPEHRRLDPTPQSAVIARK